MLDECVNAGVRNAFPGHAVSTVSESGWRSSEDGPLLALAETRFDVFVTVDRNLEYQNNLKCLALGFVIVRVRTNEINSYEPLFRQLNEAAGRVRAGEVIHVSSPDSKPKT